jgi:hypothetical protein
MEFKASVNISAVIDVGMRNDSDTGGFKATSGAASHAVLLELT